MRGPAAKIFKTKIVPVLISMIEMEGYECVECTFRQSQNACVLSVLIDTPGGPGVEDCEKVSRKISEWLDDETGLTEKYYLEVSSPGAERPLKTAEHFRRFLGKKVLIKLPQSKRVKGTLLAVDQDKKIHLQLLDGSERLIEFDEIKSANLVFEIEKQEKKKHR